MNDDFSEVKIAVVIPCYRVKRHILSVLSRVPKCVDKIFVVDDGCPESTGEYVLAQKVGEKIEVIFHSGNSGVGRAVLSGYERALRQEMDVVIKLDGDGQMDPELIPKFVEPIVNRRADYTKGNRFFSIEFIRAMPRERIFGNIILSFATKLSTGYWNIFDANNGYTAINARLLKYIVGANISDRFFFESDMLFRLNIIRAVVQDIPMIAVYNDERSNLSIKKIVPEFLFKHFMNFVKRIFYSYFLKDFSLASVHLIVAILLTSVGVFDGARSWSLAEYTGTISSPGTVMLPALLTILGVQFLLSFVAYDMSSVPDKPIWPLLADGERPQG